MVGANREWLAFRRLHHVCNRRRGRSRRNIEADVAFLPCPLIKTHDQAIAVFRLFTAVSTTLSPVTLRKEWRDGSGPSCWIACIARIG